MTSVTPVPARKVGLLSASALGVGGMMGAGLYTLLGLAATTTGPWLPMAFLIAGFAAVFSVYSYAKMGAAFPSSGGPANFILKQFGKSIVSGGVNVFQYISYLIATALYAAGFSEYVGALFSSSLPDGASRLIGPAVIVVFAAINVLGSQLVGKAETYIVAVELVILVGFMVFGFFRADFSNVTVASSAGVSFIGILTASGLLYVTYQGFGVVANASGAMARPKKELPRAMFIGLAIVAAIYLTVSTLVVLLLPQAQILADSGHVLADAGQAVLGRLGFVLVSGAAILATASAVNATIFAASNIGGFLAQHQQLPHAFQRKLGGKIPVSLIISAVVIILLVAFFPLSAVGQMTSLAFLFVYAIVSLGHLKLRAQTGARAWPLVTAIVINAVMFVALLIDAIRTGPAASWIVLIVALLGSFAYAWIRSRRVPRDPAAPGRGP